MSRDERRDGSIQELGHSDWTLVEATDKYLSNIDSPIAYCRRTSISSIFAGIELVVALRVPLKVKLSILEWLFDRMIGWYDLFFNVHVQIKFAVSF